MYNSLKKLLGIGGVMSFLVLNNLFIVSAAGGNGAGTQEADEERQAQYAAEQQDAYNKTENTTSKAMCPDGQKEYTVDGKKQCCDGIFLNTNVPFIGQCISFGNGASTEGQTTVNEQTAFPVLMGGLTKMLVTIILLISFIGILAGGVMIASSGGSDSGASNGKKLIGRVIVALAILGASGVILRLINPNFFG